MTENHHSADHAPAAADGQVRPLRIMTVCTGNICRSPIAEVVLRDRLEAAGLGDDVVVDSTGVSSEEHGNPMDRRARAVLAAAGYADRALDTHRARQVDVADLGARDLLLPMTARHAAALRRLAERSGQPDVVGDIVMFRTFDPAAPSTRGVEDEKGVVGVDPSDGAVLWSVAHTPALYPTSFPGAEYQVVGSTLVTSTTAGDITGYTFAP